MVRRLGGQERLMVQAFDLNVEKVLEHWSPAHALREVIANALDEHALLGRTGLPQIVKDDDGVWHVRDFGRGLRYQHLTQNESPEKRASEVVVGQFGVGLKDALATFHRNGIEVRISSPHGTIGLVEQSKHGFGDVVTLHAIVDGPADIDGTDVSLAGISDADVAEAMAFFLVFDDTVAVLESTPAGQVLARPGTAPRSVYVRGVRVAEDDGLLFSYNVTKVDAKLRRALNRERSNVGRSAYTDRIKAILLAVETPTVLAQLVADMAGFAKGATRDEVKWNDVAERVVRQLAIADPDTVFVTAAQRWSHPELIRRAELDGKHVFVIPDALAARLRAAGDDTVTTLERFAADWNDRVVIEPIDPSLLEPHEQAVLALAGDILAIVGRRRDEWAVVVSETLHLTPDGTETAHGLWEPAQRRIVIHRSCLARPEVFVGTLLHEIGHAVTGATDLTAAFEEGLTDLLGTVGTHAVTHHSPT
jgi:hypothetical protein